jgi:adenosylmethionine-8-amino-7-oxononanoate aminotransferase
MVGFGELGSCFGFNTMKVSFGYRHCRQGVTSAILPLSLMATRKHIMEAFEDKPLGCGSTYASHPVAMAYCLRKYQVFDDIIGHVQRLTPVFENSMKTNVTPPSNNTFHWHVLVADAQLANGENPQLQHCHRPGPLSSTDRPTPGLMGLLRSPHLHVAPPYH